MPDNHNHPVDPRKIHCRWPDMNRSDLDTLVQIERESFEEQALSEAEFGQVIKSKVQVCLMVEHESTCVGYIIFERTKRDIHVLSLAIRPAWQLRGIARLVLKHLATRRLMKPDDKIVIAASEDNLASQKAFRAIGFKAVRVERNYYAKDTDAYIFEATYRDLHGHEPGFITGPVAKKARK